MLGFVLTTSTARGTGGIACQIALTSRSPIDYAFGSPEMRDMENCSRSAIKASRYNPKPIRWFQRVMANRGRSSASSGRTGSRQSLASLTAGHAFTGALLWLADSIAAIWTLETTSVRARPVRHGKCERGRVSFMGMKYQCLAVDAADTAAAEISAIFVVQQRRGRITLNVVSCGYCR